MSKKKLILLLLLLSEVGMTLGPVKADDSGKSIRLTGNAHIDLAYRWRWNETVDRVTPDTFEGVLRMMDQDPKLTYAQSQLSLYEEIQRNRPDLFQRIRQRIAEGRWSVVGGQWAEPDAILPGGESLIRQFLIGMEYARKELGVGKVEIAWVPDSFCGQALTLPQIYAGCGIKYYLFGRGAPSERRIFHWQAPDGSRVLAYSLPVPYNSLLQEGILEKLRDWWRITGYADALILYGEGDHGGGPRETDAKRLLEWQKRADLPPVSHQTPESYFARLTAQKREWPIYQGEMGLGEGEVGTAEGSWRGSYTSQTRTKWANRQMENLYLTAEKFAALGSLLQRKPLFPRVDFRQAWKLLLRLQFHDILPGTSIGDVFDDARQEYDWLRQEGERLLRFGLEVIGSRIDTRGEGIPLVIYNPTSWARSEVVEAALSFPIQPRDITVEDSSGRTVPSEVISAATDGNPVRLRLWVKDVPSIGYRLLRVKERKQPEFAATLSYGINSAANEYLEVKWDAEGLVSLFDRRLKKECLAGKGNRLLLIGEKSSSSWDYFPSGEVFSLQPVKTAEVVEKGRLQTVVRWIDRSETSLFTREMILKAGVPRLEFRLIVDWHDHDKMLKIAFPATVAEGHAFYEQPFGVIERPTTGSEWPAQNWVDLSNNELGLSLLNDGKYGHDVQGTVIRLSVVRGARDMDPRMDEGMHSFRYALYPHTGDWRQGHTTRQAQEINQPLRPMQENHHIGTLPPWGARALVRESLPPEYSFFSIEGGENVILSALKVQQGDWSPANLILRLYECEGRDTEVKIRLPATAREIIETNHLEDPLPDQPELQKEGNGFRLKIGRHQIRTFRLVL